MSFGDTLRRLQSDVAELTRLVMNIRGSGGGGGEANTASNIGAGGVGLYHSKVGVDLRFKKINAGSAKVTVTDDVGNQEVDVDVVIANLGHTHQNAAQCGQLDHGLALTGLLDDDHTQYLLASGARALSGNWNAGAFTITMNHLRLLDAAATVRGDDDLARMLTIYSGSTPNKGAKIQFFNAAHAVYPGDIYLDYGDFTAAAPASAALSIRAIDNAAIAMALKCDVSGFVWLPTGLLCLAERVAPAPTAGYGKLFVNAADSLIYFMDDAGNVYDLTGVGAAITGFIKKPSGGGRSFKRIISDNNTFAGDAVAIGVTAAGGLANTNDPDGVWSRMRTSASAGNHAYVRTTGVNQFQPRYNPHLYARIKTDASVSDLRLKFGCFTGVPPRAATLNSHEVAFRFDTPVPDTNWMFCLNDGVAQTTIDTGVAVAVNTVYHLQLYTSDGGVTWFWVVNGTSGSSILNVPGVTTDHAIYLSLITEAGSQKDIHGAFIFWEWDSYW